jgi:hypothetical protein
MAHPIEDIGKNLMGFRRYLLRTLKSSGESLQKAGLPPYIRRRHFVSAPGAERDEPQGSLAYDGEGHTPFLGVPKAEWDSLITRVKHAFADLSCACGRSR